MKIDVWSFSESFSKEVKEAKHIEMEDRELTFVEKCLNIYSYFTVFDFKMNYADLLKYDAIISISDIFTNNYSDIMPLQEDSVSLNGIVPTAEFLGIPLLSVSVKRFKQSLAYSLETDTYKLMNTSTKGFNLLRHYLNQFNPQKLLLIYSFGDGYYSPKHIGTYNKILEILNENHSDIT